MHCNGSQPSKSIQCDHSHWIHPMYWSPLIISVSGVTLLCWVFHACPIKVYIIHSLPLWFRYSCHCSEHSSCTSIIIIGQWRNCDGLITLHWQNDLSPHEVSLCQHLFVIINNYGRLSLWMQEKRMFPLNHWRGWQLLVPDNLVTNYLKVIVHVWKKHFHKHERPTIKIKLH